VRTTTTIGITGAGLTGTLRLTWVSDDLAHVIEHAGTDEPTGTWTGLACSRHGLPIGSNVDISALKQLSARGEIADLIWEAPEDIVREHNRRHQAAMQAYQAGDIVLAEQEWSKVRDVWSRAWAANCAALDLIQAAGISRFSPAKPQRWVAASFEHHCGPHGIQNPHVHSIVVVGLTS